MTQDKATHLNIKFDDLTVEKQEALIEELTPRFQAEAEAEGKEFLAREWNDPKPQTWQEAYCREYAVEYQMWQDEVNEGKVTTPAFIWETWQEAHVRELIEAKLKLSFNKLEVEVQL